jgi:hypothetical protein
MGLPTDFASWTLADAQNAIRTAIADTVTQKGYTANQHFIEQHDHWQKGATWIGPQGGEDRAVQGKVLQAVERQFTPVDVLAEVLDRVVNAVLKREPDVQFVSRDPGPPPAEGSAEADGLEDAGKAMARAIAAWWDAKSFWACAREAVRRSRWAGRGAVRLWIPPNRLRPNGAEPREAGTRQLPTGLAFDAALALIEIDAPNPDRALRYQHPDTGDEAVIVETTSEAGEQSVELWYREDTDVVARLLTGDGEEIFRLVGLGRLPVTEMRAPVLITEPVRRQQNRLNFFESVFVRVIETGGFPERYTTNAASSGVWSKTKPADNPGAQSIEVEGETYYLHEMPRTLGASVTTELVGITTRDAEGNEQLATPGVIFKDPTDPEFVIKGAAHARACILESCHQKHVALEETAQASGSAYEQARADFEDDLASTAEPLERLVRETVEAAIALASIMSRDSGSGTFLERFRTVVTLHVQTGPVTPERMTATSALVAQGLLSQETAMSRLGVEDVEAELARIRTGAASRAELLTKQAAAIKALTDAGASLEAAASIVGLEQDDIMALTATQNPATGVVSQ